MKPIIIEKIYFDLFSDGKVDTITLINDISDYKEAFTDIEISSYGAGIIKYSDQNGFIPALHYMGNNGLVYFGTKDQHFKLYSLSVLSSDRLILIKNSPTTYLIVLFSTPAHPSKRIILELNKLGVIKQFEGSLEILEISDLNGDSKIDFVMRESCSEGNSYAIPGYYSIEPYCPFFIYSENAFEAINKPLSRSYNEEKYVGFLDADLWDNTWIRVGPRPESKPRLHLGWDWEEPTYLDNRYCCFEEYTSKELSQLRNEIFARRGHSFKSKELRSYFLDQYWYVEETGLSVTEQMLDWPEKKMLRLIQEEEKSR